MDIDSLSHSKWNCKLVFVPKYRRQIIYGISKRKELFDDLNEISMIMLQV